MKIKIIWEVVVKMERFTRHNGQLSHQFIIGEINNLFLRKNLSQSPLCPLFIFISNKKFEIFSNRTFETSLYNKFEQNSNKLAFFSPMLEGCYDQGA